MASAEEQAADEAPDPVSQQIEQIVMRKIAADKIALPPMPAVAATCMSLLKESGGALKQVFPHLERDPLLVAQVLRLAHGVAGGAGNAGPISTIEQAVTRLGAPRLRAAIVEATNCRLFPSKDTRIAAATTSLWKHSIAVGLLARDIAAVTGSPDGEAAFLTGLLHDFGQLVVAAILLDAERQIVVGRRGAWIDVNIWVGIVTRTHRAVGLALAAKWCLPQAVQTAISGPSDYDMSNRRSPGNFVLFSNSLAKTLGICTGPVDLEDAEALVMVGRSLLDLDDDVIQRLSRDLPDRLRHAGM